MASQAPTPGEAPEALEQQPEAGAPPPNVAPEGDEGGGDGEGQEESPEIQALARELGWTPPDKYKGPAERYKSATDFIRAGRDIQNGYKQELGAVRATLDTVARTTGQLVEQQVNERLGQLTARHAQLVEEGDNEGALRVAEEITRAKNITVPAPQAVPEVQSFAERNAAWFNQPGKEWATSEAVGICNELAAQGYSKPDQLRICEQRMQNRYPQLFGRVNGSGKAPPGVGAPRNPAPGARSGPKTFADLPKAAQDIAIDLEKRLKVPKEKYAENYFANESGKA